jgi:hypothetical protein
MISDGKHQFCAKKFSKQVPNQNFTTSLDDLDAFCAKGFCARKQSVNFIFFQTIETHLLQEGLGITIQTQKTLTSPQF